MRGIFLPPQMAASSALKFTGAKSPVPFFFAWREAFLLPALRLRLTSARFAACAFSDNGFFTVFVAVVLAIVVLATVVLASVVFVVVVIAQVFAEAHTSLEPSDRGVCARRAAAARLPSASLLSQPDLGVVNAHHSDLQPLSEDHFEVGTETSCKS